jgi:phage-related tail fiber protein
MPTSDSPLVMPARKFEADQKGHRSNNSALEQFGNLSVYGQIPIGGIVGYGGSTAPPGWLECNGAAISRTLYAALFSVIGTTFGVGDGSTTFELPTRLEASQVLANGTAGSNGLLLIRTGAQ